MSDDERTNSATRSVHSDDAGAVSGRTAEEVEGDEDASSPDTVEDVQDLLECVAEYDEGLARKVRSIVLTARDVNETATSQRAELEDLGERLEEQAQTIERLEETLEQRETRLEEQAETIERLEEALEKRETRSEEPLEKRETRSEEPLEKRETIERLEEALEQRETRLEELEEERVEREERIDELETAVRRKQADFQNYKKRAKKRQKQIEARATEELVSRLVGVRDNLKRALEDESGDVESLREGVEMTLKEFDRILSGENVTEIDPEPGTDVDPQRHEVMMRVDSDEPEGTVAEVFTPGYEMEEKVIQNAQVTVSNGSLAGDGGEE